MAMADLDGLHSTAQSIFDALPDDPFGDEPAEKPTGTEEQPPTDDELPPLEDADDEGEGDEPEPDTEESEVEDDDEPEDDEDEDEVSEENDEELRYSVKVDGHEVEKTLAELKAGYSRTESWTRKSQKLGDERRAFASEMEAVRAERAKYAEVLDKYEQEVIAAVPQMPTGNDPQEWMDYQRATLQHQAVQKERHDLQQRQQVDAMQKRNAFLALQQEKLVEVYPDWADNTVALAGKEGIAQYALGLGFSEDDVDEIQDHRVVILLKKAMERDEWAKDRAGTKKKVKAGPTLRPGKSRPKSPAKKAGRKKARTSRDALKQSGTVKDAAAFIENQLGDDF